MDSMTLPQKVATAVGGAAIVTVLGAPYVASLVNNAAAGYEQGSETPAQRDPVWPTLVDYFFNVVGLASVPLWGPPALAYKAGQWWRGGSKTAAA